MENAKVLKSLAAELQQRGLESWKSSTVGLGLIGAGIASVFALDSVGWLEALVAIAAGAYFLGLKEKAVKEKHKNDA